MAHIRSARGIWLLLAATLFLRALIPAGWMPDTGRSDSIAVRICGPSSIMMLPLKQDVPPDNGGTAHDDAPCLFSGFGGDAPLPGADLALVAIVPAGQQAVAALATLLLARQSFLLPPGRGPPVVA